MGLTDRVAIITGAGSGIGRATAYKLAAEGARVVVGDVINERGNATVDMICSRGGKASFILADISRWEEAKKLVELTESLYGTVDILVNNAGITRDKPLQDMEEEDWDQVLNINLKGAFNCCKFVAPIMIKKQYGKIINVSSRAHLGNPGQANYSSSKAGIIGLTRSLALELGRYNINVNALAPGLIETELVRSHPKYEMIRERALKLTPLKRIGKPEEVAELAYFLASDASSYITGELIHITGGRY